SKQSLPLHWQGTDQKWFSIKPIRDRPKRLRLPMRKEELKKIMDRIQVPVPIPQLFLRPVEPPGAFELLPDDIFHLILPYLPNEDRLSLSLTCKRMHTMDRIVGGWMINQFENVHAHSKNSLYDEYYIDAKATPENTCKSKRLESITRKRAVNVDNTLQNAGIMQRANVNHLQLTLEKPNMDKLSFIFAFTQFKRLTVKVVNASGDAAVKFIGNLLRGQTCIDLELDIDCQWQSCLHYEWQRCDFPHSSILEVVVYLEGMGASVHWNNQCTQRRVTAKRTRQGIGE
ncbi:hypothetical protein PMAYCL1PPCAC_11656, partial [Pristionchus mayeri]